MTMMKVKRGRGRPAGPLGVGVKCTIMIPGQLHAALLEDIEQDDLKTLSEAIVGRLKRGKRRGRAL